MASTTTAVSHEVDLDGPTHYLDYGGPKDGRLLVAVHGLGGAAWNWSSLAPRLTDRYRLLAIDLAGHGRTPAARRSTTVTANRGLLERFLINVAAEPVVLVGNSMGGLISLLTASRNPDLVDGVVAVDAALPRPWLSRIDARVATQFAVMALPRVGEAALRRRRERQSVAQQVQETLELCTVDVSRVDPAVIAEGIAVIEGRDQRQFTADDFLYAARSLVGMLSRPRRVRQRLNIIKPPVLMLHGEKDRLVSVSVARSIAKACPGWQLEVAPDVGHVPMLEAPQWTADRIREWLEAQHLSTRR